jgi:hypothetical protein
MSMIKIESWRLIKNELGGAARPDPPLGKWPARVRFARKNGEVAKAGLPQSPSLIKDAQRAAVGVQERTGGYDGDTRGHGRIPLTKIGGPGSIPNPARH